MLIKPKNMVQLVGGLAASLALAVQAQVIEAPAADAVFGAGSAPDITLNLSEGTPGVDYLVLVNGRNVSDMGAASGTEFVISGAALESVLRNGRNTIGLLGDGVPDPDSTLYKDGRSFYYDIAGPELRVDNVVADSGAVIVTGKAIDPTGVASVMLNGVAASVDADGTFQVSVSPAMDYALVAVDVMGDSTTVNYSSFDDALESSISVRLDNSNLSILDELIADIIDDSDLAERLIDNNPLFVGDTALGRATLNATAVDIKRPAITTQSTGTDVNVLGISPDLVARVDGNVRPCLGFFCIKIALNGDVIAPEVIIDTNAEATFIDGRADVALSDFSVTVPRFDFSVDDVDNKPFYLELSLIANIFEGIVELVMGPLLDDVFTEALEQPLEGVLSDGFSTLARIGLGLDVFGTSFDISVRPEQLIPVTDGVGLTANVDVKVTSTETGSAGLGYRSLGMTVPSPESLSSDYELSAAASVDFINQILWKVQKSGLINLALCGSSDELVNANILGIEAAPIFDPINSNLILSIFFEGSQYKISTDLYDPPYLVLNEANDAEATVHIPSLALRLEFFDSPALQTANSVIVSELVASVSVDAEINIVDGKIDLDIVGSPSVVVDEISSRVEGEGSNLPLDLQGVVDAIELLAISSIPSVIPTIDEAIGQIEIPNFAGLEIGLEEIGSLSDSSGILIGASTTIGPDGIDLSVLDDLGSISIPLPDALADLFCEPPVVAIAEPVVEETAPVVEETAPVVEETASDTTSSGSSWGWWGWRW